MKRAKNCPRCGKEMPVTGMAGIALSRRDNETYICSQCGMNEALEDAKMAEPYSGKRYWKAV